MWCFINQKAGALSLAELTDRYVVLDESTRAVPDATRAARYAEIYQQYLKLNDVMKPMLLSV
jgi:xylulokinase